MLKKISPLAALLAVGLALTAPAGDPPAPTHRVTRVSDPAARGAVEVSVAINPTNPDHLIAASIAQMKQHPGITDFAYVSTDGGRSWKTVPRANPQKRRQGDDMVTFTADGLAIHTYIAFDGIRVKRPTRADSGILTSTSRDGLTWSAPVAVVDHANTCEPMEDKPWVRADRGKDSPHKGNIYVTWTRFDEYGSKDPACKSHVYVSRSKDAGKSFSVPHRISEKPGDCLDKSNTLMGAVPAVGPKGEVYVVWGGPQGVAFTGSTDGGWTFGKNQVIADIVGGWVIPIKGVGRCDGLPSAGVDISAGQDRGSIYVTWADMRNGDPDIFLTASRDCGQTWEKPLRVNDDAKGNGKEQFFGWMAVDPVDGSVNIAFYDRRDLPGTRTGLTLARSVDGGRSFVNHKINQEPFECQPKVFFGDYLGVDAFGGRVAVLYQYYAGPKQTAISSAVFDFRPGTQQLLPPQKTVGKGV
jgi:hypothetical protein